MCKSCAFFGGWGKWGASKCNPKWEKSPRRYFPLLLQPGQPIFPPVFSSWQQLACLNRNLTWSLFSATVFCGPHYNAQVFGSPIYKYKWHIYRIVHTRPRGDLWTSHLLDLPFFVWTRLYKWERTSHTQSEYPHVAHRPRVGTTGQSLLGYGHALLGIVWYCVGIVWYCMGMLFLGMDMAWWAEFGQEAAMLIHAPAPECLLLIMETSNWPASHYWYGTSLPAHQYAKIGNNCK